MGGLVVWRLRVLLSRGWPGPRIVKIVDNKLQ